jgi:hypothetical protein
MPEKEQTGTHNPHKPTDPKPNTPEPGPQGANVGEQTHTHDVVNDHLEAKQSPTELVADLAQDKP